MRLLFLLLVLSLVGCSGNRMVSKCHILYTDKEFMSGDITVEKGNSMVLMPPVYKGGFLPAPSYDVLAEPLQSRHDFLRLKTLEEAALALKGEEKQRFLSVIPQAVKSGDLLTLGEIAPLLRKCGIAFFQIIRVEDIAKIRTKEGALLRKVSLQIEILESGKRQTLWRGKGEVRTLHERSSDEEVLMVAIKELYRELPKFYFNTVHETW